MAGIGFELKKIYKKDGISRTLTGALYSSIVTIGPTLIVIVTILLLYLFLGMSNVSVTQREVLSSTILYVFIFSVILTAPFNSVFSRYLADKFYVEEFEDILPSYYTGILCTGGLSLLAAVPMMASLYFRGGVDLPFILAAYVMWVSAVLIFFSVTYLHATKDYKIIAIFFLIGMLLAGLLGWILYHFGVCDEIHSILYGLAFGFFCIAFSEFSYIRRYFKGNGQNYTECLTYLRRHFPIFATNLFYMIGLYVHNFVFWTTDMHLHVANTYYSHQAYDMASCLAMFTNISTIVIFTVIAETRFHDTYQRYMESVIGGTYKQIQKNKKIMFRTLSQQMSQVFGVQLAITAVLFLLILIFGVQMGFSGMILKIYPVLAAAYLGIFMMYCNIVYLYYFDDTIGSMLTGLIFLAATFLGTLVSKELAVEFFGLGAFFGMICGWTFSFFRIRWVERSFEGYVFCRYKIIETMKSSAKGKIVYRKGE